MVLTPIPTCQLMPLIFSPLLLSCHSASKTEQKNGEEFPCRSVRGGVRVTFTEYNNMDTIIVMGHREKVEGEGE